MTSSSPGEKLSKETLAFASYAADSEQLKHVCFLAESIREFAGRFSDAAISVYMPADIDHIDRDIEKRLSDLKVAVTISHTPEEASWIYFSGKVFAAAKAEKDAEGRADILAWLDEDTIVLKEPDRFLLDESTALAYRPVMHNRSGSLFSEPPDTFWSRVYEILKIRESSLFPMETPADRKTIRAYFNAGLLVVRPERGILRNWGCDFERLYSDQAIVKMCENEITRRIFVHQAALVGALNIVLQPEMTELPETYNYPLFFHHRYEATEPFERLEGIVTLRYDVYFRNPEPDWADRLKASESTRLWLKKRLG